MYKLWGGAILLMGLGVCALVGVGLCWPSRSAGKAAPAVRQAEANPPAAAEQPPGPLKDDPDPVYIRYGLAISFVGKPEDERVRAGYHDSSEHTIYLWKGVTFPASEVPPGGPFMREPLYDPTGLTLIEIDPPVWYVPVAKGHFAPGYYARTTWRKFYRWDKVLMTEAEIPDEAVRKGRVLRDDTERYTLGSIPMPAHLANQPQRWKKLK